MFFWYITICKAPQGLLKPSLFRFCHNTIPNAKQMLTHRKKCLSPILKYNIQKMTYQCLCSQFHGSSEICLPVGHVHDQSPISMGPGRDRTRDHCKSRGRKFDPSRVPFFRGDWSWNNFYGHSPPFRWIIQEGSLSVTSEVLVNCLFKLAQEKVWLGELTVQPWP